MSSVSVVMVTYHTGDLFLRLAMDSVLAEPECAELILVNNGNPPGLDKELTARASTDKRIRYIKGHGNTGFAKACNLGAKSATGDYILLLNPDSMVTQGALARALEAIRSYPPQTMAGCYLQNPSGSEQRGGRRGLLTPLNAFFETFGLSALLPASQRLNLNTSKMPPGTHEVPAISGAFMLLARSYYQKLGGMDEAYFLHMEDMDLCYRVHKSGGKIICVPEARVVHFRSTSEASSDFVEKEKARSFVRYLKTHTDKDAFNVFLAGVMTPAIWARYYLKTTIGKLGRVFEPPLYEKQKSIRMLLLHRAMRFAQPHPALAGKVALVTGASGQLGLSLVAGLLGAGVKVIAVTRRTRVAFRHENLVWSERDFQRNPRALQGANVNFVIHAADMKYLGKMLPDIAQSEATRLVAFSCLGVSDKAVSQQKRDKRRALAQEKAEKELVVFAQQQKMETTIFRTTDMYGAGLDKGLTKQADIIKRYGRLPIEHPAKGLRQPVHVGDVASIVIASLANPQAANKVYALGGAGTFSYREMLERVFTYFGKKPSFLRIPAMKPVLNFLGKIYGIESLSADTLNQMNRSVLADNTLATQELGFSPRHFLQSDTGL